MGAHTDVGPGDGRRRVVVATVRPNVPSVHGFAAHARTGWIELDLAALGVAAPPFHVDDLLGGGRYLWHAARNYVEIDSATSPGHIFAIRGRTRREHGFEYYL